MAEPVLDSPVIVVPVVNRRPDPFRAAPFVDFVLTRLAAHETSWVLWADMASDGKAVWAVGKHRQTPAEDRHVVSDCLDTGTHRSALARIGHRYMGGQPYGGAAEPILDVGGRRFLSAFYMANDSWRGFWVRVYIRPVGEPSAPRDPTTDAGSI